MKKNLTFLLILLTSVVSMAQVVTATSFMDDYSTSIGSEVTYSTLYPLYYVQLDRDVTNQRYKVVVEPKVNQWRPIVIGFDNANSGAGIDISGHPIMKIRIIVPSSIEVPDNNNLKIAFYISDNATLGEYDPNTGEDYLVEGIEPGTDTTLTFDWSNAKQVTNWGVWPPTTGNGPNLTAIKSIGFSMNTNSTLNGTYYIKRIEFGNAADCEGVNGGTAYVDGCNTCVGGTTGEVACVIDCSGEENGTAQNDACGNCSGGNTGITPVTNVGDCPTATGISNASNKKSTLKAFPSPGNKMITLSEKVEDLTVLDINGSVVYRDIKTDTIDVSGMEPGIYLVKTEKGKITIVVEQ